MTHPPASTTALSSRADVVTGSPERYAKQLVAHLGRKTEFVTAGSTSTAPIGAGTGAVTAAAGLLTLVARAPDRQALELVEHVLGSHLERFGARNELTVSWHRTAPPAP